MKKSASLIARVVLLSVLAAGLPGVEAKEKASRHNTLAEYIQRLHDEPLTASPGSPGSLWVDNGSLTNMAADYKANRVGDLLTILVVQDLTAVNSGNVATDRSFKANSGIDGLFGRVGVSGVQNIFTPHSTATLSGKSQLVMNNEKQTILVRGLVRPGDVAPDNTVMSNVIGDLELELKGKGVLSDGTRPPNVIVRLLLRIVGF